MPKPHKFREVTKKLRKYDKQFTFNARRGKGSERIICHDDIDGKPEFIPVKCHGEGTELGKGALKAIIRRFNLPDDFFD